MFFKRNAEKDRRRQHDGAGFALAPNRQERFITEKWGIVQTRSIVTAKPRPVKSNTLTGIFGRSPRRFAPRDDTGKRNPQTFREKRFFYPPGGAGDQRMKALSAASASGSSHVRGCLAIPGQSCEREYEKRLRQTAAAARRRSFPVQKCGKNGAMKSQILFAASAIARNGESKSMGSAPNIKAIRTPPFLFFCPHVYTTVSDIYSIIRSCFRTIRLRSRKNRPAAACAFRYSVKSETGPYSPPDTESFAKAFSAA